MYSTFGFLALLLVFGWFKVLDQKMLFVPVLLFAAFAVSTILLNNRPGRKWAGLPEPAFGFKLSLLLGLVGTIIFLWSGIKYDTVKTTAAKNRPATLMGPKH